MRVNRHPGQNISEQHFTLLCSLQQNHTTLTSIHYHLLQIMNILRTATLVAIFIKCVTASNAVMSQFRKAVDEGDMDTGCEVASVEFGDTLKRDRDAQLCG